MLVVFDSNVWIKELGLTSTAGSAVRFFLRRQGARIALPEVVRLEVERKLRQTLEDRVDEIVRAHRELLAVFGELKEVVLPTPSEIQERVSKVFSELGVEIEQHDFSMSSARGSFMRVIGGIAPSGEKNQQFKDGVLWEDCLALAEREPVILVTDDGDFYEQRDRKKGLARSLVEDQQRTRNSLKVLPSIEALLQEVRVEFSIEPDHAVNAYLRLREEALAQRLRRLGFALNRESCKVQMTLFGTEIPSRLFARLLIEVPLVDMTEANRSGGLLAADAEAVFDVDQNAFVELSPRGERVSYISSEGESVPLENVVAVSGVLALGHRTVTHSVRVPLM